MNNDGTSYQYTFNDDNSIISVGNNSFHYYFGELDYNITVTTEGTKDTYYQGKKKEKGKKEKED